MGNSRLADLPLEAQLGLAAARGAWEPLGLVRIKDHRIVWANGAFAAMFGWEARALIGQSTRALYPSDDAYTDFARETQAAIDAGRVFRSEAQRVRKDGTLGWYAIHAGAIAADGDETVDACIPIDRRKEADIELAQSQARLQNLFVAMAEGLVFHGPDGRVVDANPAAEQILGLSRDELLGRT